MAGALSTPLVAQQRSAAWVAGLAATVGTGWQLESVDIGYVRPIGLGPLRFWSVTGRFGTFQDEGAFLFGSRGINFGLVLGGQTASAEILSVGAELSPVSVGFDVTFEAGAYVASKSPFPQGNQWLALAILPGIRTISTGSFGASIMAGPIVFIGHETNVRALIGLHFEIPVAQGPAAP